MIAPNAEPDFVATLRALLGAGRYRDAVASWLDAPAAEARRSEALLLAATASLRLGEVAGLQALKNLTRCPSRRAELRFC